jgi:hypothetical protein
MQEKKSKIPSAILNVNEFFSLLEIEWKFLVVLIWIAFSSFLNLLLCLLVKLPAIAFALPFFIFAPVIASWLIESHQKSLNLHNEYARLHKYLTEMVVLIEAGMLTPLLWCSREKFNPKKFEILLFEDCVVADSPFFFDRNFNETGSSICLWFNVRESSVINGISFYDQPGGSEFEKEFTSLDISLTYCRYPEAWKPIINWADNWLTDLHLSGKIPGGEKQIGLAALRQRLIDKETKW